MVTHWLCRWQWLRVRALRGRATGLKAEVITGLIDKARSAGSMSLRAFVSRHIQYSAAIRHGPSRDSLDLFFLSPLLSIRPPCPGPLLSSVVTANTVSWEAGDDGISSRVKSGRHLLSDMPHRSRSQWLVVTDSHPVVGIFSGPRAPATTTPLPASFDLRPRP